MDESFLEHSIRAEFSINIMAIMTTTKFETKQMQDFLFKAVQKAPRMKSKVTQIMGKFYFEQYDDNEFALLKNDTFVEVSNIHTKQDVEKFCEGLTSH
jgi:hypothetical protein